MRKLLTETPVCPRERLVIISYTTGLSFAEERIGPLAAIVTTVFYLLALYLLVLPNTPKNLFASIYSESMIKTTHQHLLLLVGFDTLIYQKYYDTPLYLWVIKAAPVPLDSRGHPLEARRRITPPLLGKREPPQGHLTVARSPSGCSRTSAKGPPGAPSFNPYAHRSKGSRGGLGLHSLLGGCGWERERKRRWGR
jgi:hypothetical protein